MPGRVSLLVLIVLRAPLVLTERQVFSVYPVTTLPSMVCIIRRIFHEVNAAKLLILCTNNFPSLGPQLFLTVFQETIGIFLHPSLLQTQFATHAQQAASVPTHPSLRKPVLSDNSPKQLRLIVLRVPPGRNAVIRRLLLTVLRAVTPAWVCGVSQSGTHYHQLIDSFFL